MRSKDLGMILGVSREFSVTQTTEMFSRICLIRAFETNAKGAYDAKLIKCPIYLSLGQESVAAALSIQYLRPFIFAQHRCHDVYLAYGGDKAALRDELLHLSTGCAGGMGGSASIHDPSIGMFGHSGFMGDQIPIAIGFALGSDKRVLAIMGDASAEEDFVITSLGYAAHKKLPILFVCLDNNLSILTKVEIRRNWKIVDIARAFGLAAVEITDDPWLIMHHVKELMAELPAFMNIHVCRHLWHSGTGIDGEPEWNRFQLIIQELSNLGFQPENIVEIQDSIRKSVDELWRERIGGDLKLREEAS